MARSGAPQGCIERYKERCGVEALRLCLFSPKVLQVMVLNWLGQ
jgi:hypothetical protein